MKNIFLVLYANWTGDPSLLYITTSNKDGRGNPQSGDDKVIKIYPQKL